MPSQTYSAAVALTWGPESGYIGWVYVPGIQNGFLVNMGESLLGEPEAYETLAEILGEPYTRVVQEVNRRCDARETEEFVDGFPYVVEESTFDVTAQQLERLTGLNGQPPFELYAEAYRDPDNGRFGPMLPLS